MKAVAHGKDQGDEGGTKEETSSSYSYYSSQEDSKGPEKPTGEGDKGNGTKDESREGKPGIGNAQEFKCLEDYLAERKFLFVHHFAGPNDPLSAAMEDEAAIRGIKLKVVSVELMAGTGDLTADEPYKTHLSWAKAGRIDAYHSGFPCSTFSRLRLRPSPGMPGPLRSKAEPYGLSTLTEAQQLHCDNGTVMACRSIDMAHLVAKNPENYTTVPSVATLENPPETDDDRHLSAWELPEMEKFLIIRPLVSTRFNTCAYEPHLPVGKKHFKSQRFDGTLLGLQGCNATCQCGDPKNHEAIVGPEKSKASGEYPAEFCKKYARLAVHQLWLRGKEEYLKGRIEVLQQTIDFHKKLLASRGEGRNKPSKTEPNTPQTRSRPSTPPGAPKKEHSNRSRTPLPRHKKGEERFSSPTTRRDYQKATKERARSSGIRRRRSRSRGQPSIVLRPNVESQSGSHSWQGGDGNYGKLKGEKSKAQKTSAKFHVGGMRNPLKVVSTMSNLLTLGIRIRAAWEAFVKANPKAMEVGENYGATECSIDERLVDAWKSKLKMVLGAKAPPMLKMASKYEYKSKLEAEMLEAWRSRGNDPEVHVPRWIREGTPLGINEPIGVCGVFPAISDDEDLDCTNPEELEDAGAQLQKGAISNYTSVRDNEDEAKIELQRYREAGFLRDVPKDEVRNNMKGGTISRLGLILKQKPGGGVKRRIILDLRRSGGNRKAHLPEKLVLPRPAEALEMARNIYELRRPHGYGEGYAREFVVIDISDAFMALGVHHRELEHTLAPALLFGYKTAPLLWSRVAAMLARMLQSLVVGHEAQHQVYLDDSLWILQGGLRDRNLILSMILTTMCALNLKVSLAKGERSTSVKWIGVNFQLAEETLTMSLPTKFCEEVLTVLKSWDSKGMAPISDLRKMAGRLSWLSGILPRTRWLVAVFYRVLHERLRDINTGAEEARRQKRDDSRAKDQLFYVKQLEQPRVWMIKYIEVAALNPSRNFKLDITKYPKASIVTDASPQGLGALLLINGRITRAMSSLVTQEDAKQLGFEKEFGTSSSQGIVETLAVLVALKLWTQELKSCQVTLQVEADSMVALAMTKRMANSNSALNYLGAELAVQCELAGIERLKGTHIPGSANIEADYLSRRDKWDKSPQPANLANVTVKLADAPRTAEYYHLPTPLAAPGLWLASTAANTVWASLL